MGVYRLALCMLVVCWAGGASASEAPFLQSLAGNWTGSGMMKRTTASSPINLSCSFQSKANGEALSMDGKCTGMLVVSRAVSAQLSAAGGNYAGRYIGPSGRVSSLSGARRGDAIELGVTWSRIVNGDRSATMTIQRSGANALRIRTVDKDPASGKQVVTSEINLQRK